MTDSILVPVELRDPEPLSPVLVEDIASLDIVLLGHYDLPEQTPAGAARDQFEAEAQATLEEIANRFRDEGADVRTRLVFGKDRESAIDQVAIEEDCSAELNPAPTEGVHRILVPIPDVAEFSRLPEFLDVLCEDFTQEITLFHVVEGEKEREEGTRIVTKTREGLIEAGFDPDGIDTLVVKGEEHDDEILEIAADYDAMVMYEAELGLSDRIFGNLPDRIADQTGDPVVIVRRDY
ncbi:MAG: universal stress protein [Halodesulfurarchaeum sp.]|nr:universal stress protein [Halodesulfurarchaeum sp.]